MPGTWSLVDVNCHCFWTRLVPEIRRRVRVAITKTNPQPSRASPIKGQLINSLVERGSNFRNAGSTKPKVTTNASNRGNTRIVNSRLAASRGVACRSGDLKGRNKAVQTRLAPVITMNNTAKHKVTQST